jgi:hypothetical protein
LSERGPDPRHTGLDQAGCIVLEERQVDLLQALVEAHRTVEPRVDFRVLMLPPIGCRVEHPGLTNLPRLSRTDVEALAELRFIRLKRHSWALWEFSITHRALRYYGELQRQGTPAERVEQTIRRLIESQSFKARFPDAYAKWAKAEELLCAADALSQLTAVGHHCREAVQDFANALVAQYKPPDCPADPASTVARVRAVLNVQRSSLPSTVHPFLDALLAYWGTVIDLHQRQEHGAQREGRPLTQEDGRRVVFQTLLVMYEIDRALSAEPQ